MSTSDSSLDPALMDRASPEYAAYCESIRPPNLEPAGLPKATWDDGPFLVVVEVETAEWRVITLAEYIRRQMHDAQRHALNQHPSPTVVVYCTIGRGPYNRETAYHVATVLEGMVAPCESPWPEWTKETMRVRIREVDAQWDVWRSAEVERVEPPRMSELIAAARARRGL